eukprot:tig00021234_g19395.t1
MTTIAALLHRHAFGLKGDVKDNVCYLEEQSVIYPAGHNTIIYNIEQRAQKFIPGTEKTEGITAMCVSPNRKYVAIAEKSEKGLITVFDLHTLKRRKVLSTAECGSKEYISMCFSPDSKFLLSQGGAPDWTLVLWTWEKAKVAAFTKTTNQQGSPIYQCSFNPVDSTVVAVTGNTIFKLFRVVDNNFKQSPSALGKREPQNYLCHTWMSEDRLLVASDTGDLLLIEGGELKMVLPQSPADGNSIDAILPYSKGFVCGGDGGILHVFEKSDDKDFYKRSKTFKIENNAVKIKNLAVSPSEESLLCSLENNQTFVLTLSNTDILKADEMNFDLLSQSFHSGPVTGVDVCIRKPLVVTSGTDKSVRVWNYLEKTMELMKMFTEEAFSVAFHPSGLHILVGFSDKLKLMNLLMDDIRPYKEFAIKACRECRFSNGGQYFAAVNGNTIQIFATYTCENIGNLRGHNGKVRSVHWSPDDSRLISAGMDGAVYEWKLKDFKREGENVLKSCNYTCVVGTPDGRSILAVGSDRKLKEISGDSIINKEYDTGPALTQIVLSHSGRMFFAGSEIGTIRSYKFPLTGEYQEYQCHSGPVSRLRISFDDMFLFCASDDSTLYIFDIRDKEGRARGGREKEMLPYAEEILVTKSDLEEKTALMQELKTKVEELTMQNEYQLRLKDLNYNEKIKEITEKFTQELEADRQRHDHLLQEKNDMEMEYEEQKKQMEERHQQAIAQIEAQYQQKIMAEVERYQQLMKEKEEQNERWDEQNALLVESHERQVQELTEDYENKIQELQMEIERLKKERDDLMREFEETKRQIEEDADREIEELKEKSEGKLANEREAGLRLKGENGIMRKKFSALQKDIEDQKEDIKALHEKEKELYATIQGLEKDIAGLKKEIRERDETIGDKEKRIYDLKKKNQELEKFKFVLDYKIKELKKQIEPRELEIADMKEQIKEMDAELERYHKNNSNLELTISDLRLKLDGLQRELATQHTRLADTESTIRKFRNDLQETVQNIQDPKLLKESIKKLYAKHVTSADVAAKAMDLDSDIQKEYQRQRDYLEKTVDSLKRKLAKDVEMHRQDNMRIMQENVTLIKEINELRREIKNMRMEQRAKEITGGTPRSSGGRVSSARSIGDKSKDDEIFMQREEMAKLRRRIEELEAALQVVPRPSSRERLPPVE